jgi:hypothetical protein
MKKINLYHICVLLLAVISVTGCYKRQTDYQYNPSELDPHYKMTVKEYMLSRGSAGVGSDTPFKWMQKAIEYAGVDLAEYEKTGRTYILLHTDAVRRLTSGKVTAGFFFDYPIIVKDGSGIPIKSILTPALDSTRPAVAWEEYSKETIKNLLLYLIVQGEYGFDKLTINNTAVTTLLPANTKADPKDSRLGWVITKTTPNPDITALTSITFNPASGSGFDPEGKMNLRIGNNDVSPIIMNDRVWDRTAGYFFTNGRAHVFSSTSSSAPRTSIDPFRYSWTE